MFSRHFLSTLIRICYPYYYYYTTATTSVVVAVVKICSDITFHEHWYIAAIPTSATSATNTTTTNTSATATNILVVEW